MYRSSESSLLYLWNLRTLYIGPLFEAPEIIPAASSLVIGLDEDIVFHLRKSRQSVNTRIALLPAGVAFGAETGDNIVAMLYLDPVGHDLRLLQKRMGTATGGIFHDCTHADELIDSLRHIFLNVPPASETYRLLQEKVFLPAGSNDFRHDVDPRIWHTINYVKTHAMDNLSSQTLAEQVGMSEAQLRRCFKQTTGIPLRRYRRWHRLFITASMMASGITLTDAALAAGFSDSSHFNHAFREMTGMKPSSLLRRKEHVRIQVGQEDSY